MEVYLKDDKTHVDPQPHDDILWGLKGHFVKFLPLKTLRYPIGRNFFQKNFGPIVL